MICRLITAAALVASAGVAACLPVTAARITGRDLALADPAFSALPATYTVAIAPEPGTPRRFSIAELEHIAAANRISAARFAELCFEIPMRHLVEADVEPAMRRALPPGAGLKILEISKNDAPAGEIEFALTGLEPSTPSSGGAQLWRGFVRYAETRKASIWARVAIAEHFKAVIAVRDLAPNTVIPPDAVRLEERSGPPPREKIADRIEDVAGRQLTRPVRAGDAISAALLMAAWDVKRGDSVRVEVKSGEAHLNLDAIAEAPAREGDLVELRNPASGKVFRARLEHGRRAVLIVGSGPQS